MRLDVQVSGNTVAQLYRERDEYVLEYLPGAVAGQFVSLTMPVREAPWRWPRDMPPRRYAEMVERLCESAVEVGKEVIEAARNEARWRTVAKHMVHAWNEGMSSLRDPRKSVAFRGLDSAIAAAGFSEPERPGQERTTIGRSTLLAPPRKP